MSSALHRVPGGWIDPRWTPEQLGWDALFAAPVAIGACRADGQFLLANDALFALLRYTPEEVTARGWIPLLYREPEEQALTHRLIGDLAREGGARRHRRRIVRGDGSERLLDVTSAAFDLPDGTRGIITAAVDVTEDAMPLRPPGPGSPGTVDESDDVLARLDVRTGKVLYCSAAIERMMGYGADAVYRDPELLARMVLPESRDGYDAALRAAAGGEARSLVMATRHRDGGTVHVHLSVYPIRDPSGRVLAVEGVARDVTAMRALEQRLEKTIEELRARNDELASLDRLKSQLLANVSHELRTPLVSIKGYNELILRGSLGPLTARQRRGLEIAGANTERLVELIETLLDFARREERRIAVHRARIDVRAAVREATSQVSQRIGARGLTLSIDVGDQPLEIDGDHARIVQVVRALLSNAEKFSIGDSGTIRVVARADDDDVVVEVTDTGIGIPAEARHKIFDRFYQVDASPTRRFGGAGLGLALAREIVLLHDGAIEVVSAEERGSSFTVRLPAAAPGARPRAVEQPVLLLGVATSGLHWIGAPLQGEGYALLHADSAAEVARRTRRHRPDLVLLALEGSALDEAVDELGRGEDTRDIPVVALASGERRPSLIARVDAVVEPGQPGALSGAIRRLLEGADPAPARPGATPPRVVVVDDEPEILDFTNFLLEREGFEVCCVGSGETALRRIDPRCDLVILDVAMEGCDGIEVCRAIKGRPDTCDVPVLVVTAMSGDDIRRSCFDAGADGFLLKPFGVAEFLRQVRLHVRSAPTPKTLDTDGHRD